VIASVTAASQGKSVVLLHPGLFIGGMTSSGLGLTDFGNTHVIGGRSRQFYRDVGKHYRRDEEWLFEPHGASKVFDQYLQLSGVQLELRQFVGRAVVEHRRLREIVMLSGLRVRAKCFIDATYEGDLMALSGVTYTVGREPNSAYGETIMACRCATNISSVLTSILMSNRENRHPACFRSSTNQTPRPKAQAITAFRVEKQMLCYWLDRRLARNDKIS